LDNDPAMKQSERQACWMLQPSGDEYITAQLNNFNASLTQAKNNLLRR